MRLPVTAVEGQDDTFVSSFGVLGVLCGGGIGDRAGGGSCQTRRCNRECHEGRGAEGAMGHI